MFFLQYNHFPITAVLKSKTLTLLACLFRSSLSSDSYLLIDGQQRVTTTLIFLAAIRDTLKSLQISHTKIQDDKNNLLARINSFLFVDGDPKEPKLTPCYLDRKSFFGIIMADEKIFLSEAGMNFFLGIYLTFFVL